MKKYSLFILIYTTLLSRLAFAGYCVDDKVVFPDAEALPAIKSLAMTGDSHSQAIMGEIYFGGKGVQQDTGKGLSWLEKSAVGGDKEGQYVLALYYAKNGKTEADFQKAANLFQKSADQNCPPALFVLGGFTLGGKGVPKNTEMGLEMIRKSADAGYHMAQMAMATMLITGNIVKKDPIAGFAWAKRAADDNYTPCQLLLASLYLDSIGTIFEPEKARILYETVYWKKDEQSPTAAYGLGLMYMDGKGVQVDIIKAFKWMLVAANAKENSNVSDAVQRLKALTEKLPKQKLTNECSIYMDPKFATNGAKEYKHANAGETVAILSQQNVSTVYFPNMSVVGYIQQKCLN
jgi:TPR repeat protein